MRYYFALGALALGLNLSTAAHADVGRCATIWQAFKKDGLQYGGGSNYFELEYKKKKDASGRDYFSADGEANLPLNYKVIFFSNYVPHGPGDEPILYVSTRVQRIVDNKAQIFGVNDTSAPLVFSLPDFGLAETKQKFFNSRYFDYFFASADPTMKQLDFLPVFFEAVKKNPDPYVGDLFSVALWCDYTAIRAPD